MLTSTDQQLINKALKGNKKAWFSLLDRYEKPIFNYALRMTGNPDDAKDLMQEIFVSVFNSLPSFTGKGQFKAWLFRIAHFKSMDFYRRKRPDISLDDAPEISTQYAQQTSEESPEASMQYSQSQQHIQSMMQALPFNMRVVLELKFFSQFTFDEIAEQLGISPNTVKSRLYSALAKLKDAWEVDNV